jgi:competence protein ComEA
MGNSLDTLPLTAAPPQPPGGSQQQPVSPSPAAPTAAPAGDEAVESHFWLTRSDQLIFGLLALVMLALFAVYWVQMTSWGTRTVEIERLPSREYEFRIDANSATWVEWGQIQGIGDALARRIVADREQNGPFRSVDDLGRVKGIGPKILEHLRPWVRVAEEAPPSKPAKRKRTKSRANAPARKKKAEEPTN